MAAIQHYGYQRGWVGKECTSFGQYLIKIYNKGLQYNRPGNILRIEIKIKTMHALKFRPICFADLRNPKLWEHCKKQIEILIDNILLNEPVNIEDLTKNEKRIYLKVIDQTNFTHFSRDQKKRYKNAFNNIIVKNGIHGYRTIINDLINEKFNYLLHN